jgi:hypothetical protein
MASTARRTIMRIRVYDIQWEKDGSEVVLPSELCIEVEDHESAEDELSDMISDQVGFLHKGFLYEVID